MDINIFNELVYIRKNILKIEDIIPIYKEPELVSLDIIREAAIGSSRNHDSYGIKGTKNKPISPIYIRDQASYFKSTTTKGEIESNYKFHVTWCKTLEEFYQKGTFVKYVTQTRTDGKFTVNIINQDNTHKEKDVTLNVCKNCLREMDYKNYLSADKRQRNIISYEFLLKEFYKKYKIYFPVETEYTDETAPVNRYSDDWRKISAALRKRFDNTCQRCGEKGLTHVHHKDGNKANENPSNLRVFCEKCHADIHPHLKNIRRYHHA